jgi:Asp/Glu/hydantoin racemase
VIGLLRTTMHAALNLADKVGFTVPLAPHVPYTRRILRAYGLEQFVAGMKPIGIYGLDLDKRKDEIFDKTAGLIRSLMEEGAEIIIPLGGAIIPYVVDPLDLQRECGIQVLNTKAIGIRFAEMCVALGMTQSPVTYPRFKLKAEDFTARI